MAITSTLSSKELERIAVLAYEGKTLKVMLCNATTEASLEYDENTSIADWKTIEINATGYAEYSQVVPAGSYDLVDGRYEIPYIDAEFTATDSYSFNRIVMYLDSELYPHSLVIEDPGIVMFADQIQRYRINLNIDD